MKGDAPLVQRLSRTSKRDVSLPQPVIAELAYGLARMQPSKRRERLQNRFEAIQSEVAREPWTDEVSTQFGAIKASLERRGERIEDFDAAIAAHALAVGAVLVSSNADHMARVPGLRVEDWTKSA